MSHLYMRSICREEADVADKACALTLRQHGLRFNQYPKRKIISLNKYFLVVEAHGGVIFSIL